MSLRETIRKYPSLVSGLMVGVVVVAIAVTVFNQTRPPDVSFPAVYWTADDGKTFFEDRLDLIPPHVNDQGVEQVRALVFRKVDGGEPFVGYLMKYTPEGKAKLEELLKEGKPLSEGMRGLPPDATLYKRPGDGNWVAQTRARSSGLLRIGDAESVLPE